MNKSTGIKPKRTVSKNTTEKRGSLSKFTLAVLVCLILVTTLTGCVPKAPHEHYVAALKKVNDLDYLDFEAKASMLIQSDLPENQGIYQILSRVSFEVAVKLDKEDHQVLFDFNLLYKGAKCGNLTLYCDLEKIAAQSVFLGPKIFYFEWKDLQPLVQKYFDLQLQIADYFPLLLETDEKMWEEVELAIYDFYADYYQDKITVGDEQVKLAVIENGQEKTLICKELLLQMDSDAFSQEETSRLLQGLFGNPAVRTLFKDKITQFITIAKNNGDLATWPITEEELIAFRNNIDVQIDYYITRMGTVIADTTPTTSPTSITRMEGKILIDQKGLWRSMLADQTMHITNPDTGEVSQFTMKIEQNLVNPGQKPTFPDFLPAAMVNVGQTSAEEWAALGQEIYFNLFAQAMVNPFIQDIIQLGTETE
ncbi:MAG TPA: hypothetical protein GXZ36_04950 [Firmicutes bacterium]|nr:hypothetical protein [Bacillota bacterium]